MTIDHRSTSFNRNIVVISINVEIAVVVFNEDTQKIAVDMEI